MPKAAPAVICSPAPDIEHPEGTIVVTAPVLEIFVQSAERKSNNRPRQFENRPASAGVRTAKAITSSHCGQTHLATCYKPQPDSKDYSPKKPTCHCPTRLRVYSSRRPTDRRAECDETRHCKRPEECSLRGQILQVWPI